MAPGRTCHWGRNSFTMWRAKKTWPGSKSRRRSACQKQPLPGQKTAAEWKWMESYRWSIGWVFRPRHLFENKRTSFPPSILKSQYSNFQFPISNLNFPISTGADPSLAALRRSCRAQDGLSLRGEQGSMMSPSSIHPEPGTRIGEQRAKGLSTHQITRGVRQKPCCNSPTKSSIWEYKFFSSCRLNGTWSFNFQFSTFKLKTCNSVGFKCTKSTGMPGKALRI